MKRTFFESNSRKMSDISAALPLVNFDSKMVSFHFVSVSAFALPLRRI